MRPAMIALARHAQGLNATLHGAAIHGQQRDYTRYPYSDYRTNDDNTFRTTDPLPDPRIANKDMVFGVVFDGSAVAYPWSELERVAGAPAGIVEDTVAGEPIALVFDLDAWFVHAYRLRDPDGDARSLTLVEE